MYHPYFRGKQYELITIRENARLLAGSGFCPIIEPVKESLKGLRRALDAVEDANGRAVLIVNPIHGDHSDDATSIHGLLADTIESHPSVDVGVLLSQGMTVDDAVSLREQHAGRGAVYVHAGFSEASRLAKRLDWTEGHVFLEDYCGRLYRRHFDKGERRVLVRDGFHRRRNADHPAVEQFSDLHVTYSEDGMTGFGDFLVVGDDFSLGGGPAYAVAIHVTFIDADKDDEMFVHHFVSDRQDTPTDPAGKFGEAVRKLVADVEGGSTKITRTSAVEEFIALHRNGHFPGLGYVKKLSMQHHIETLASFFSRRNSQT